MVQFDRNVITQGLHPAAEILLKFFRQIWNISGDQKVPRDSPLLILSNHPGMTDTLGLISQIPREDLKIIAASRPFLQALPSLEDRLILVSDTGGLSTLKPALEHLKSGGAILSFPAGRIEPDPRLDPHGAKSSQEQWFRSAIFFKRQIPGLKVLTLEVSGVISPESQKLLFLKLWKNKEARGKVAAVLQLLQMIYPHGKKILKPIVQVKSLE